jgi:broad specificity phosphatase PhoE
MEGAMQRRRLLLLLAACGVAAGRSAGLSASAAGPGGSVADGGLWQRLQGGGLILLVRHAATDPGIGDPPGFVLAQCPTQRNLSAAGRRDAQALGAALRAHDVPVGRIWSSRWCRCLDTARLAFGQVEALPLLDSQFRQDASQAEAATAALRARLTAGAQAPDRGGNTVLVTHDVNIRALVDLSVVPGEAVLLRAAAGKLEVLGRVWRPG